MSASLTGSSKARSLRPAVSLPRPRLTVVPRPAGRAPRLPFVALVVALLTAGLVGLLLLNTGLESGAYRVSALRSQESALQLQQQALLLKVAALQEPQAVAEKAQRLGMVANVSPAFISLETGKILGTSIPGSTSNRFDISGSVGDTVGRLAKNRPDVAGAGNSAGVTVDVPALKSPGASGKGVKRGDTSPTSPSAGH